MSSNLNSEEKKSVNKKSVIIICPICKIMKEIIIPVNKLTKPLNTISIQKGKICDHTFQLFIDKNFAVRGYQKVDHEIENESKLPKGDFLIKVIILGDFQVGKTAITRRFVENKFDEGYLPTLQLKISKRVLKIGDMNMTIMIWDIGGQITHMAPYRSRFYQGAQACLIVIDRTRNETLDHVERWYKDAKKSINNNIPFILVGNKSDLQHKIMVSEKDLKSKALEMNFKYMTTSAKTSANIEDLFIDLSKRHFEYRN